MEALKFITSIAASNPGMQIMIKEVKRAYFHALVWRPAYVEIPPEDRVLGEEGMVGELQLSMYGTIYVAQNWQETLSEHLESIGFKRGI